MALRKADNNIASQTKRPRRKTNLSKNLDDFYVEITIGAKEILNSESDYRIKYHYTIIDKLLTEI